MSEEAGQLAEDYRQAHSTTALTQPEKQPHGRCPKCGESGHWTKDCTRPHTGEFKQPKCYAKGHLS